MLRGFRVHCSKIWPVTREMYSVLGGKEEIWMVILCVYHRKCTLGRCGQVPYSKILQGAALVVRVKAWCT